VDWNEFSTYVLLENQGTAQMRGGAVYKFSNPVVTHSLKAPGLVSTLEPVKRKTGFKPLLSNGSTCTAYSLRSCRGASTWSSSRPTTVGEMYKLNPVYQKLESS
jgi:hypothetical protein